MVMLFLLGLEVNAAVGEQFASSGAAQEGSASTPVLQGSVEYTEKCYACCGEEKWYLNHESAWQQNAYNCLGYLQNAYELEEQGLAAFDAHDVEEGNRLMAERGELLKAFQDCAMQANRGEALKANRRRTIALPGATGGVPDPTLQQIDTTLGSIASKMEDTMLPPHASAG